MQLLNIFYIQTYRQGYGEKRVEINGRCRRRASARAVHTRSATSRYKTVSVLCLLKSAVK